MKASAEHGSGPVALIALNMGGPADQEGVVPFLEELFADKALVRLPWFLRPFQGRFARMLAERRGPEVRENYRKIGGGSPIGAWTRAQVQGASARLLEQGIDALPLVAMRYSAPRARDAAKAALEAGASTVVALSLYPQYSPATGGSSLDDLRTALAGLGLGRTPMIAIDRFATAPFYLDAMAAMVNEALGEMGSPRPHVLFSAHGLPKSYILRGDPYLDQIRATYDGVVARLPKGLGHSLSFQSRVGRQEWLEPYTDDHLRKLAGEGIRRLVMVPCGFVSDHVETLYEMDMLYGDLAKKLGITDLRRIPALNDHPGFLRGLGDLVAERLGRAPRTPAPQGGMG